MRSEDGLGKRVPDVAGDIERVADRPLSPEDVQALKDALFDEPAAFSAILASERTSSSGATLRRRSSGS